MKVHIGGKETSNQRQNIIWKCILKKSLYPEIEKTIRFLHDYETAEISYHEIKRKCRVHKLDSE